MKIKYPNASSINKIGLQSEYFSFSAVVKEQQSNSSLWICPIGINEILDVIEEYSLEYIILFDIDHNWFETDFKHVSLEQLARIKKLECKSFGEEVISIKKESLKRLIKRLSHYNFHAFDFPSVINENELIDYYFKCNDYNWNTNNNLLTEIGKSSWYIDSHDDCYLYIESLDRSFLNCIFERAMQTYVGTIIFENKDFEFEISFIPKDIIDLLLLMEVPITIQAKYVTIHADKIQLPYSNNKFSLTEQQYNVVGIIEYDFVVNKWSLSKI